MATLQIPDSFKHSYERHESYPRNLVCQTSYAGAINAFGKRLNSVAPSLFVTEDAATDVPFRDLRPGGQGNQSHPYGLSAGR